MPRADWLDFSAIGVSGLCLVHCLASGVFVVGLSAVSLSVPASHEFHLYTLIAAFVLAAWALGRGWLRLRRGAPVALGAAGLVLMGLGAMPGMVGWPEMALTVTGVVVLAAAHVLNWRALRQQDCDNACARERTRPARLKDAA